MRFCDGISVEFVYCDQINNGESPRKRNNNNNNNNNANMICKSIFQQEIFISSLAYNLPDFYVNFNSENQKKSEIVNKEMKEMKEVKEVCGGEKDLTWKIIISYFNHLDHLANIFNNSIANQNQKRGGYSNGNLIIFEFKKALVISGRFISDYPSLSNPKKPFPIHSLKSRS